MGGEKWGNVEPPCIGEEDFCLKLVLLGNNLFVLCINILLTHVNVMVIEEYGF